MFLQPSTEKPSLFLNPAHTALIVLGASTFYKVRGIDHPSFGNAVTKVVAFFKDNEKGLGLPDENIHNGFDSDSPPAELITAVLDFLQKTQPTDLFVYACSHGFGKESSAKRCLFLALKESRLRDAMSDGHRADEGLTTCLRFDDLIRNIQGKRQMRTWYIVDCCSSGLIHHATDLAAVRNVGDSPPTSWQGDTFITANNRHKPGKVLAGTELPPFTEALLDVLQRGVPQPSEPLISLERLCDEIRARLPSIFTRLEGDGNPPASYTPDCSDRDAPLSEARIFQNNHASHHAMTEQMAKERKGALKSSNTEYDNMRLRSLVDQLEKERKALNKTITEKEETRSELDRTLALSRGSVDRLEGEKRELNQQLSAAASHTGELETRLGRYKNECEELGQLRSEADQQVTELKTQLDQCETRYKQATTHLKSSRRRSWFLGTATLLLAGLLVLAFFR
jgi:archaellum component FlaC